MAGPCFYFLWQQTDFFFPNIIAECKEFNTTPELYVAWRAGGSYECWYWLVSLLVLLLLYRQIYVKMQIPISVNPNIKMSDPKAISFCPCICNHHHIIHVDYVSFNCPGTGKVRIVQNHTLIHKKFIKKFTHITIILLIRPHLQSKFRGTSVTDCKLLL